MIVSNSEFYEIVQDKSAPREYDLFVDGGNLIVKHNSFPMGIRYMEFECIKNTIEYYQLKCGVEIGTGLGISATAAGLGFKKNKGKLITIDSYVEEDTYDSHDYRNFEPKTYHSTICKDSIDFLIQKFDLSENVFPEVGWSPNDIPSILAKHNVEKIDYAFIDGGHFKEQFLKDLMVLMPYLDKNFVLFFHDSTTELIDDEVNQFLITNFGRSIRMVLDKPWGDWLTSIVFFD